MTTLRNLAPKVLEKLQVLAAGEAADAGDLKVAEEKLYNVHAYLDSTDLVRWTPQDVPAAAREPYIMMAAFYAAPDFQKAADPSLWAYGLKMIQSITAAPISNLPVPAEYF